MKKILLADDDLTVQDIFKRIFEREGYQIEISSDGNTLYDVHRKEWPDLLLLDKQLASNDGLEICKYLKAKTETRHIPILMISATPGIEKLAFEAGANDFLEKPFQVKELLQKVEKLLK